MKEKIITEIINEMLPALNNGQLKKLKDVLEVNLYNVAIVTRKDEENEPETQDYLEIFLSAKRIEGCSEKTLTYYRNTIHQMMESIGKTVCTIETEDLRTYLSRYQAEKESSKVTIDNIKLKEKNLHLMETKLLQEQINPHFLYNTLDTIVWLAEDNRNEEAVAMVTSLSDFFRTTLCQGRDYITVREEEAHIISYLKIQQFRYQDIMDYEIQIEEEMKKFVIPKLLLQPLVENALYHGVKKKRGKSLIRVKGFQKDEKLIFQVIDNGKGMSAEELNTLRENVQKGPDERKNKGFGLANVNQRIRHYYGETYGLYIESTENEGTEATIIIAAKNIEHLP